MNEEEQKALDWVKSFVVKYKNETIAFVIGLAFIAGLFAGQC